MSVIMAFATPCFLKKVLFDPDIPLLWAILIPVPMVPLVHLPQEFGTTDLEVGILKGVCTFRAPVSMKCVDHR